jgi:hypothetical protein
LDLKNEAWKRVDDSASTLFIGAAAARLEMAPGTRGSEVELLPEIGIGIGESEAGVPGFVAAPNDLGVGLFAGGGVDQFDALMHVEVAGDDGFAAGVGDVDGNGINLLRSGAFIVLDHELDVIGEALGVAHGGPAFQEALFYGFIDDKTAEGHTVTSGRAVEERSTNVNPVKLQVNSTFLELGLFPSIKGQGFRQIFAWEGGLRAAL